MSAKKEQIDWQERQRREINEAIEVLSDANKELILQEIIKNQAVKETVFSKSFLSEVAGLTTKQMSFLPNIASLEKTFTIYSSHYNSAGNENRIKVSLGDNKGDKFVSVKGEIYEEDIPNILKLLRFFGEEHVYGLAMKPVKEEVNV